LDYWGNTLNLASRLNEFARPKGVTIAGTYKVSAIPEDLRDFFDEVPVYIRSICEEKPFDIFYQKQAVEIDPSWQIPIREVKMAIVEKKFLVKDLKELNVEHYNMVLAEPPLATGDSCLSIFRKHPTMENQKLSFQLKEYSFTRNAGKNNVRIPIAPLLKIIEGKKIREEVEIEFVFEYTVR